MEVVHINDVLLCLGVQGPDVLAERLNVELLRSALHQDLDAASSDRHSGHTHDDAEEVSADRVNLPGLRAEVNDNRGNNDTDGHDAVADHVKQGGVDVQVALSCHLFTFFRFHFLAFRFGLFGVD